MCVLGDLVIQSTQPQNNHSLKKVAPPQPSEKKWHPLGHLKNSNTNTKSGPLASFWCFYENGHISLNNGPIFEIQNLAYRGLRYASAWRHNDVAPDVTRAMTSRACVTLSTMSKWLFLTFSGLVWRLWRHAVLSCSTGSLETSSNMEDRIIISRQLIFKWQKCPYSFKPSLSSEQTSGISFIALVGYVYHCF